MWKLLIILLLRGVTTTGNEPKRLILISPWMENGMPGEAVASFVWTDLPGHDPGPFSDVKDDLFLVRLFERLVAILVGEPNSTQPVVYCCTLEYRSRVRATS